MDDESWNERARPGVAGLGDSVEEPISVALLLMHPVATDGPFDTGEPRSFSSLEQLYRDTGIDGEPEWQGSGRAGERGRAASLRWAPVVGVVVALAAGLDAIALLALPSDAAQRSAAPGPTRAPVAIPAVTAKVAQGGARDVDSDAGPVPSGSAGAAREPRSQDTPPLQPGRR
jgi:hypothetical protein